MQTLNSSYRGFVFTISNCGQPREFTSQRAAIQWARPRWTVGRVLQIFVTHRDATSNLFSHSVSYRKARNQEFDYIGRHAPAHQVNS